MYGKKDLSRERTNNMLVDIGLDMTEVGIDFGVALHKLMNDDPTWDDNKWEIADGIAQLIAYRWGLSWEGPKSDLIWPARSVMKDTTEFGKLKRQIDKRTTETFDEKQRRLLKSK